MPGSLGRVHTGAFSFCWSHFLSFILPLWAVKQDPFSSSLSSTSTEPQRRVLWGLPSFYQSQCEHLTVFFLHDWHLE